MSIKESVQNFLKPREVKKAEKLNKMGKAHEQLHRATIVYLEGKISLEQYKQTLEETSPLTKLDLRKLASEMNRRN